MTQLVRELTTRLASAGLPSAASDARLLVCHVLQVEPGQLFTATVTSEQTTRAFELARQRAAGVPVQHLTGVAWFRTVELSVGPGVFVPRPETELLVDLGLARIAEVPTPVVVDLGTGSGAIAKAVAAERPTARVVAVELSPDAHRWAARNLASTTVELRLGNLADACDDLAGTIDLVLCNPPYVPTTVRPQLPRDVVDHDPDLALFAGADGLDVLRVLSRTALRLLRPGGWVVAEHDDSHGPAVVELFTGDGWAEVSDHRDLVGRDRHVVARRPGAGVAG